MGRASIAFGVVLFVACSASRSARADNTADAEALFLRGKALVAESKSAVACPLFEESYRLDPAQGTLLNLALCDEDIGKIATAWGQFRKVEQQARRANPPRLDRADLAQEHADKLEPRLSRVRIQVPASARVRGLLITVDGEQKGEPLWAEGIIVDPGMHVVEASAPSKKTARVEVQVHGEKAVENVVLRPLDDVAIAPPIAPPAPPAHDDDDAANRARRSTGWIVGAAGLAVAAAGGAFGVAAIVNNDDAKKCGSPCYRAEPAGQASDKATDRALTFANVANVTVPLGLIAVAVGVYLVVTAGPTDAAKQALAIGPRGFDLAGRF